jgi:6-phosphogluconolactonase/glucosamine-6-phosphate isomerase/deaminase
MNLKHNILALVEGKTKQGIIPNTLALPIDKMYILPAVSTL